MQLLRAHGRRRTSEQAQRESAVWRLTLRDAKADEAEAAAAATPTGLQTLQLERNALGDAGARALATALLDERW